MNKGVKVIIMTLVVSLVGVFSYLIFYTSNSELENSHGTIAQECPIKVYQFGEIFRCPIDLKPTEQGEYKDRQGCKYIIKNDGSITIKRGDQVQVVYQNLGDKLQYLEVDFPTDN